MFRFIFSKIKKFISTRKTSHSAAKRQWEAKWRLDDFSPPWINRGIASEIIDAVNAGWLPAKGVVLDIGCGLGEIAAWFSSRNYQSVGIDIAQAAIDKACNLHVHLHPLPAFFVVDICATQPPNLPYNILIDRGCLHQIAPKDRPNYIRHLAAVIAPDARMLLFIKAFRSGQALDDAKEIAFQTGWVQETFAEIFVIEKVTPTFLDPWHGKHPEKAMPGLVFWLIRLPSTC